MRNGVLRPGEPLPVHPQYDQVGFDLWKWLKEKATYRPLTSRQMRVAKWLTIVVAVAVAVAGLWVLPNIVPGLGAYVVNGESIKEYPHGSSVFSIPLRHPRPGEFVVAVGSLDGAETVEDTQPQVLIKKFDGSRLVSTNTDQTCSNFQILGRVVFGLRPLVKQGADRPGRVVKVDPEAGTERLMQESRFRVKFARLTKIPCVASGTRNVSRVTDGLVSNYESVGPDGVVELRASRPFTKVVVLYAQDSATATIMADGAKVAELGMQSDPHLETITLPKPANKLLIQQQEADTGLFLDLYEVALLK